ncbi:MAG: DUF1801 domain-containing protein [Bacteroidota bacterium]
MAKAKDIHDPVSVDAFIQNLESGFADLVTEIRRTILESDPEVGEQIKWNSPGFFYKGEMKPFNAKEYKRDVVVMNLRNNTVLLVFPTGSIINDEWGLLEGNYADGRRMLKINSLADFIAKKDDLQAVIRNWLSKVEKP